jgi:hypothetical protein
LEPLLNENLILFTSLVQGLVTKNVNQYYPDIFQTRVEVVEEAPAVQIRVCNEKPKEVANAKDPML